MEPSAAPRAVMAPTGFATGQTGARARAVIAELWISLVVVVAVVASVALIRLGRPGDGVAAVLFLVVPIVGALVVIAKPRQPIGWIYLVVGTVLILGSVEQALLAIQYSPDGAAPAWIGDVESSAWPLTFPLMSLSMLWFPDGRLPSVRWRALAIVTSLLIASQVVMPLLPLRQVGGPLDAAPQLLTVASFACIVSVPLRYRTADATTREQMRWLLLPVVLTVATVLATAVTGILGNVPAWLEGAAPAPVLLGVPITVGIAILSYRVFDIDVVLSRTALYLVLTVLLGTAYAATVLLLTAVGLQPAWLPAAAGAAVAVLLAGPLHTRGVRLTDRWLFGDRQDPLRVLAAVAATDEGSTDPNADLVTAIALSMRLSFVALDVAESDGTQMDRVAVTGSIGEAPLVAFPITHKHHELGTLVVATRSSLETLGPKETALLSAIAAQVAVRLQTQRMASEVQHSRTQIVHAAQEERRRLRRDLHDGLGARLTAIGYTIEAADRTARTDPAEHALTRAKSQTTETIAELRRIIDGLRPAALDELGLVAALTGTARTILTGAGIELQTSLPDDTTERLDAATESALYLIGVEAVTNIVHHSHADHAHLALLKAAQHVTLTVEDDGAGRPTPDPAQAVGIGITSMRERAEELGGRFTIADRQGGGTVVTVVLPLTGGGPGDGG